MVPSRPDRSSIIVREEQPADRAAIRVVNESAFGRPDEADLVEALHAEGAVLLSLVAEVDARIAGHILFNRMSIETPAGPVPAVSLAPMAVMSDHQRTGIGSRLVQEGLSRLRDRGEAIVLVLGHRNYYPRFGFSAATASQLESPFPPDAFMALELSDGALNGVRGNVKYPAAFGL